MGQNFIRSQFRDCKLLNLYNNFCHPNNWLQLVVFCVKFILKLLKKHVTGQIYRRRPETQKLLNQFNNSCYLTTSFDLKIQDIVQTTNQRDNQKCGTGTKFYKRLISRLLIIESTQ